MTYQAPPINIMREQQFIVGDGLDVVVPYPPLMETYTLLGRRVSNPAAHRWLTDITARISLIAPSASDYQTAQQIILRYPDASACSVHSYLLFRLN